MDHNIEWLFQEVYSLKKTSQEKLHFISDWDVQGATIPDFEQLIQMIYSQAGDSANKYNYAYEQFALKEQIISLTENKSLLAISEEEITITPSATISIFLAAQGLFSLGVKRLLVITPAYFSTHDSIKKAGCTTFYYHLEDTKNFSIDFSKIEMIVHEQYIDGIILTDPVYSSGIEISLVDYAAFAAICNRHSIYFVVDYSLGGLHWDQNDNFILNMQKVSALKTCSKFLFIDTLTKRLLLNGIKFSIVIGDEQIVDKIDLIAETVYGGLSSVQCLLIKEFYNPENADTITQLCQQNIKQSRQNYQLIQSVLLGSDFHLTNTNSGYFSLVCHNNLELGSIDTKAASLFLLRENGVIFLTNDRFTYFPTNKFGFRINLNRYNRELIFPLRQCIGIDYSRFYKGQ